MQAFALRLQFDQARARDHQCEFDVARDLAPQLLDHCGSVAHVFDTAVGAGTDEHLVDVDVVQGLAWLKAHVGQRPFDGATFVGVLFLVGVGNLPVHAQHHFGGGAPGDLRHDARRVEIDVHVEFGVRVGVQRLPVGDRMVPFDASRGQRPAFDIVDRLLVHSDQAGARAGLDGHVADSHAAFHAECADRCPSEFDGVACAAGSADPADDGQHDVLRDATRLQYAFHPHQHVPGLLGQQGLGGHDMLYLAGADPVGEGPKGAVGRGMRVAADNGHSRQRGSGFRSDDVDDTLALGQEGKVGRRAVLAHVGVQCGDLLPADWIGDAVVAEFPTRRWRIVVGRCDD